MDNDDDVGKNRVGGGRALSVGNKRNGPIRKDAMQYEMKQFSSVLYCSNDRFSFHTRSKVCSSKPSSKSWYSPQSTVPSSTAVSRLGRFLTTLADQYTLFVPKQYKRWLVA